MNMELLSSDFEMARLSMADGYGDGATGGVADSAPRANWTDEDWTAAGIA